MTKILLIAGYCCLTMAAAAQRKETAITIPLQADSWTFRPGAVQFMAGAMKITSSEGVVLLKSFDFSDGTIEFDHQPVDQRFASIYFRWQDSLESECFYFRTQLSGDQPAVQYTPFIKGVSCWNIFEYDQANVSFQTQAPNHIRLVISGRQMRVYINDQQRPAMEVPCLEGNSRNGTLGFGGQSIITNLVVHKNQVDGLDALEGPDPTYNDSRYLRHWQMTRPDSIPKGIDFSYDLLPGKNTEWQPITAERRGMINLTRLYGQSPSRRIVFLKTKLHAAAARSCQLRLGFSNDVWVYINGRFVYSGKNYFGEPSAKLPDGRLSIENTTVTLPLQQGDNELMIGVGNDFFGWAIMARLDDVHGIGVER